MCTYPEYAQNYEEDDLEEVPVSVVCDLKEYQLATAVRVHGLQGRQAHISGIRAR